MGSIDLQKLLLIGSAGFVGTNYLLKSGLINNYRTTLAWHNEKPLLDGSVGLDDVKLDMTDRSQCEEVISEFDYVINFSGVIMSAASLQSTPLFGLQENLAVHLNLFKAAYKAKIKKLIWLSSCTAYPELRRPVKESDYYQGQVPDRYKLVGQMFRFLESVADSLLTGHVPVITLRPSGIYGEYDNFDLKSAHALPALIAKFIDGKGPDLITTDKAEIRDWIYVGDVVAAVDAALAHIDESIALNVASGYSVSMYELSHLVIDCLKLQMRPKIMQGDFEPGTSMKREIDCHLSNKLLGPLEKTPLSKGIKETIKWYREHTGS